MSYSKGPRVPIMTQIPEWIHIPEWCLSALFTCLKAMQHSRNPNPNLQMLCPHTSSIYSTPLFQPTQEKLWDLEQNLDLEHTFRTRC